MLFKMALNGILSPSYLSSMKDPPHKAIQIPLVTFFHLKRSFKVFDFLPAACDAKNLFLRIYLSAAWRSQRTSPDKKLR